VGESSDYARTVAAGKAAVCLLNEGAASGRLQLSAKEQQWLRRVEGELEALPGKEDELYAEMTETCGELFDPASYGFERG
jgi:hypothetical protein